MKNDGELNQDLRATEIRLRELGREVEISAAARIRLRGELLRRHHELSAQARTRPRYRLWSHLTKLRRLPLIAVPALAAALTISATLFALQISGHQRAQTADAARITQAFARSVPGIHEWRWTLHEQHGRGEQAVQFRAVLASNQALRFYYGQPYLYDNGRWTRIAWNMARAANGIRQPTDWEWAFAILPSLLKDRVSNLPGAVLRGRSVVRFADVLSAGRSRGVSVTAWVDAKSGLVLRIQRLVRQGTRLLESDVVDYSYSPGTR